MTYASTATTIWQCASCGQWISGNAHICPVNSAPTNELNQVWLGPATLDRIANALERIAAALETHEER